MLHSQLKYITGYTDSAGRPVVAGDVYTTPGENETQYSILVWIPGLYRFGWLSPELYQALTELDFADQQAFNEASIVEVHRKFTQPGHTYAGNLFITPEKFTHLFA